VIERISDFLAWLGGADQSVLSEVKGGRSRFAQMGGVLLTTAGIAVASMSFAMHDAVRAPWWLAVTIGVFWGFVIVNLDRLLVLSIGATRNGRHMLLMAAPRLVMAAILAIVISTPLVLRIFSSDINSQLFIIHEQVSHQQRGLLANSNEAHQAAQLQKQITAQESILAGHLPVSVTSPALQGDQAKVASLQTQQAAAQAAENKAIEAYQCEADGSGPGCAGASNKLGEGPIYQAKLRVYQQDKARLDQLTAELNAATAQEQAAARNVGAAQQNTLSQDQAQAGALLPKLKKQYAGVTATLAAQANYGSKVNNDDNGLLAQIRALFAASATDPALGLVHLAVFLLFFMIEILPVTVKLLLAMNKESAYDSVARRNENSVIDAADVKRAELRMIAEQKSKARIEVEADMRQKEIDLGKHANQYVETAMMKILDAALQNWGSQVTARLAATGQFPASQVLGNGAGAANGGLVSGGPASGGSVSGVVQASTFFNLPGDENL
jgi:Domain of unknown function (DUF4407)